MLTLMYNWNKATDRLKTEPDVADNDNDAGNYEDGDQRDHQRNNHEPNST